MKMFCIQALSKDNDRRSAPMTGTPDQLLEILKKSLAASEPVIRHDDYIIVISELDPEDDEQFTISQIPLMFVSRFNQFLSRYNNLEVSNEK